MQSLGGATLERFEFERASAQPILLAERDNLDEEERVHGLTSDQGLLGTEFNDVIGTVNADDGLAERAILREEVTVTVNADGGDAEAQDKVRAFVKQMRDKAAQLRLAALFGNSEACARGADGAGDGRWQVKRGLRVGSVLTLLMLTVAIVWSRSRPAEPRSLAAGRKLYLVGRDFNQSQGPGGHADFQGSSTPRDPTMATTHAVEKMLGDDGKPVLKPLLVPGFTGQSNFDQWFRSVESVNKQVPLCMVMGQGSEAGSLKFDSKDFFPLDGLGFNDARMSTTGDIHNYYFTMEIHEVFVYMGGESVSVRADDDIWIFINGSLALDLGGIHRALSGSIALDDLKLTKGSNATLDVFAAKRRCCGSELQLQTNIHFERNACEQETTCCLFNALRSTCVEKKKWWTVWCPPPPPSAGRMLMPDVVSAEQR
jgi:fibro-slime domain-containing protein